MLNAAVKYDWSLEGQPAATAAAADADAEDHVVVGCYYVGRRKTTVAFFTIASQISSRSFNEFRRLENARLAKKR